MVWSPDGQNVVYILFVGTTQRVEIHTLSILNRARAGVAPPLALRLGEGGSRSRVAANTGIMLRCLALSVAFSISVGIVVPTHERAGMPADRPLLGAVTISGRNSMDPRGALLAVRPGHDPGILITDLPTAHLTLALSPRGRFIALAEGAHGLWLAAPDGSGLRRLLLPPQPHLRWHMTPYRLAVRAVAWSPDRYTLAYAVDQEVTAQASFGYAPLPDSRTGIWLTRYNGGPPRQFVSGTQIHLGQADVKGLSWSADGRTLVVATDVEIDLIDSRTGTVRLLTRDSGMGAAFSPAAPLLAYVVDEQPEAGPNPGKLVTTLYVADEEGRHPRALVSSIPDITTIAAPIWAPDGGSIAYAWSRLVDRGPHEHTLDEVHAVDIATGHVHTILRSPLSSRYRWFDVLGWLPARG